MHTTPQVYLPIAAHSFGWIDGVSVTPNRYSKSSADFPPLSILIRGETDNPWSSGLHSLDLFSLRPNPTYRTSSGINNDTSSVPYIFPPTLTSQVHAIRGPLRCRDVILGRCGTAVWIHPRDRAVVGLVSNEELPAQAIYTSSGHESLVAAAFPGPLAASNTIEDDTTPTVTRSKILYTNHLNNWTSLDYDEEVGRIALSSSFGRVLILEL